MQRVKNFLADAWKTENIFPYFMLLLFTFVLIRNAWIGDDAYVTFRTVDNFLHGHGLTWNTDERVQAFTNPLWMFLVSLFYIFTKEFFFTVLFLSILISAITIVIVLFGFAQSYQHVLFAAVALTASRAFVDYTASGLENPLTHLILALFFWIYFQEELTGKKLLYLSLLASLGALNRLDTFLLFLPALLLSFYRYGKLKGLWIILAGSLPLFVWELFSLFYYGFLFPNTAYAKLNTGIPAHNLIGQGLFYVMDSISGDPVTLLIIFVAIMVPIFSKVWRDLALSLGILLYMAYTVKVGGDFMSGRFFAAPFFCSVLLLLRRSPDCEGVKGWSLCFILFLMGLSLTHSPLRSDSRYNFGQPCFIDDDGIADERGCYYQSSGLLRARRDVPMPDHGWRNEGLAARSGRVSVYPRGTIGYFGLFAGPKIKIIDVNALSEPLLARLPPFKDWRIGHFMREIPQGYLKTRSSGNNYILDLSLATYYDKLSFIIRGPLFSWERIRQIWKMNRGDYNSLIQAYLQHPNPRLITINISELQDIKRRGTPWDEPTNVMFSRQGMNIVLNSESHGKSMNLSVDHNDDFEIRFFKGDKDMGQVNLIAEKIPEQGLNVRQVAIPKSVSLAGFDHIKIYPLSDDKTSLGHLRILD